MLKKILLLALAIICLFSISFTADPFYTNLLNEGKQQYLAGKLDEALESFKLAEFGLLDEKEYVPELYYFYALTQYKKGAMKESKALLETMKSILGEEEAARAPRPKVIERDFSIMIRALDFLDQPGAKASSLAFFNLFYETWDLLEAGRLPDAEAKLKGMKKMDGDKKRLHFLEGLLAFQKKDYKRCLNCLEKISGPLPAEFGEETSFMLAYSYLKRNELIAGEKWAKVIKDPTHVQRIMALMEEIKAGHQEKRKN